MSNNTDGSIKNVHTLEINSVDVSTSERKGKHENKNNKSNTEKEKPADEGEYLLTENKQRFVLFPIKHKKIWEMVTSYFYLFFFCLFSVVYSYFMCVCVCVFHSLYTVQKTRSKFLDSRRNRFSSRFQGLAEIIQQRTALYQKCTCFLCCIRRNCARKSGMFQFLFSFCFCLPFFFILICIYIKNTKTKAITA